MLVAIYAKWPMVAFLKKFAHYVSKFGLQNIRKKEKNVPNNLELLKTRNFRNI
jgi:hypothetical protein